jgi:hypothetical protein
MKQIIRRVAALVIGLGLGAIALAGLETVTHIQDLNSSWPLGSDLASTSDDHIRNIKSALKTDFPNFNGTYNSASAPVFAIPNDANTGMYGPSADNLAFATGGTQRVLIGSNGNVTLNAPSSGSHTITLAAVDTALQIVSGNSSGSGNTDVQIGRAGSTANTVGTGPNFRLGDTTNSTFSMFQHSGGQTELWQFNSGAWSQVLKVSSAHGVTIDAPISGVAFTVSAVSGTHSTKIADSANNSFNAGFLEIPLNGQSANYTLVLSDSGKSIYHASGDGAGDTYTIPANSSVAYPTGTVLTFINSDTNSVSIAITTDTMTLCGTTTTGTRTLAQNGEANAIKVTSTAWIICGTGLT